MTLVTPRAPKGRSPEGDSLSSSSNTSVLRRDSQPTAREAGERREQEFSTVAESYRGVVKQIRFVKPGWAVVRVLGEDGEVRVVKGRVLEGGFLLLGIRS